MNNTCAIRKVAVANRPLQNGPLRRYMHLLSDLERMHAYNVLLVVNA